MNISIGSSIFCLWLCALSLTLASCKGPDGGGGNSDERGPLDLEPQEFGKLFGPLLCELPEVETAADRLQRLEVEHRYLDQLALAQANANAVLSLSPLYGFEPSTALESTQNAGKAIYGVGVGLFNFIAELAYYG